MDSMKKIVGEMRTRAFIMVDDDDRRDTGEFLDRIEAQMKEPVAWMGLYDSQWVNIVNHPDIVRWDATKDDSVHLAVKLTEEKLKENNAQRFTAPPAPAVLEGWKLVPVEPTDEQLSVAWNITPVGPTKNISMRDIYREMLNAAPNKTE